MAALTMRERAKDTAGAGLVPEWMWTVGERELPGITEESLSRAWVDRLRVGVGRETV